MFGIFLGLLADNLAAKYLLVDVDEVSENKTGGIFQISSKKVSFIEIFLIQYLYHLFGNSSA